MMGRSVNEQKADAERGDRCGSCGEPGTRTAPNTVRCDNPKCPTIVFYRRQS